MISVMCVRSAPKFPKTTTFLDGKFPLFEGKYPFVSKTTLLAISSSSSSFFWGGGGGGVTYHFQERFGSFILIRWYTSN